MMNLVSSWAMLRATKVHGTSCVLLVAVSSTVERGRKSRFEWPSCFTRGCHVSSAVESGRESRERNRARSRRPSRVVQEEMARAAAYSTRHNFRMSRYRR